MRSTALVEQVGDSLVPLQRRDVLSGGLAWGSAASLVGFRAEAGKVSGFDPVNGLPVPFDPVFRVDGTPATVASRAAAQAAEWPADQSFVQTQGHVEPGDLGGALWKRAAAEPAHPGKFQSADGAWWELATPNPTPATFGALGEADDAAALLAALAYVEATGRNLRVPGGTTVKLDSAVEFELTRGGLLAEPGAVLDLSGGGSLRLGPGVERIADLAADIEADDIDIEFAAPHGLVEGDVIAVWNPTDYSQNNTGDRFYYRAGDMFQVAQVPSATTVRIYGAALEAFAAADVQVFRLRGGAFSLEDATILPNPAVNVQLWLDGLVGVRLDGVRSPVGASDSVIEVFRCYDVHVRDPRTRTQSGDAYTVVISNSQRVLIDAVTASYSDRHCVALGGRDGDATVPTADVLIRGMLGDTVGSEGVAAADVHGGCKRITYDGCRVYGATFSGADVTYRNCDIIGRPHGLYADGLCLYGQELVGGDFVLDNCRLITHGNGADFGLIHLNINQRQRDMRVLIRNLTIDVRGTSPHVVRAIILNAGSADPSAHDFRLQVDGLDYTGSDMFALVAIGGTNDVSARVSLNLKNVRTPPSPLLVASIAANYGVAFSGPGALLGASAEGDADLVLNPRGRVETRVFNTELTANRTVSFVASSGAPGDKFRIVRTAGGAFALNVGGLTTLAQGESCDVEFLGDPTLGDFVLTRKGNLT